MIATTIQGADHKPLLITWEYDNGQPVDLTGATLSGTKRQVKSDTVVAIEGNLNIVNPVEGTFTWTFHANDILVPGSYILQFFANYADTTTEISMQDLWILLEAQNVT